MPLQSVPVRCKYFDCRYGQLHTRIARPPKGFSPIQCPLLCLHQSPKSSRQMVSVLERMGVDRFVYAPDFPGYGQSAAPAAAPSIEEYAAAVGDLLDHLDHQRIDIYGYHTGAMNAVELALKRPEQVRRMVLIGVPILTDLQREAIHNTPWPVPLEKDGSHLMTEWQRAISWAGPGQTLEMIAEGFADKLLAGRNAFWGAQAAASYNLAAGLAMLDIPILVIGPNDDNWENTQRAAPLLKNGSMELWPEYGFGVMDVAPDKVVRSIRGHLDACD